MAIQSMKLFKQIQLIQLVTLLQLALLVLSHTLLVVQLWKILPIFQHIFHPKYRILMDKLRPSEGNLKRCYMSKNECKFADAERKRRSFCLRWFPFSSQRSRCCWLCEPLCWDPNCIHGEKSLLTHKQMDSKS